LLSRVHGVEFAGNRASLAEGAASPAHAPIPAQNPVTLFAAGDIMLGRNVEALMNERGMDWPFAKTAPLFGKTDIVFTNLEGPIPKKHVPTLTGSTNFSFKLQVAEVLKRHGITLVSLANNHTFDKGAENFAYTRKVLNNAGIATAGHPIEIPEDAVYETTIRGRRIVLVALHGLNVVRPGIDEEKAFALVAKKAADEDAVVMVSIHWGDEYQLHSNKRQQDFARGLIGHGADLVMGHHPHVVQEVEEYKGKLIFYSLGNFIFDQYFSRETQEGLALRFAFNQSNVTATLLPVAIVKSQPVLMEEDAAKSWLEALAARSDEGLRDMIRKGIVELP
jgi:poly-gamma-glutamate synthesis protein (capsule biosynthesis protein)